MFKKTLLTMLLMAFMVPWAVGQSTATFNDGTYEYSVVPVYGTYADYGSKSQFIIPATDMAAKNIPSGATISKLTFYHDTDSQQDFFGTSCIVEVGEVSYSYFSTATFETSGLTTVFSGTTLTRNTDGTMDVTFSTDYTYHGGNLLISIGGYGSKSGYNDWYGIQSTNDLSVWAYNSYSSQGNIPTTATTKVNIVPKTTITYTSCTVDLTGNATLTNDFSSSSNLDCWTLTNCSGSTGTTWSGRFRFWCDSSHDYQYLITPEIIAPSNGILVKFDYKYEYESYYPKMRVGYSTSGNDVSDFNNWTDWITVSNGDFVTFNESFMVSGIKYIAIQYDRNEYSSNSHLYIDDLVISKAPATATTNGNWNSAAIWSTGAVPSSTENVVITSNVTIPDGCTATANNITISGGSLTIADGGQLVCNNAVNATMQRHIDAYAPSADPTDGWYFIASPVSYDPDETNMLSNTYDLFLYDEENVMWRNYENTGSGYDHFTMQPKQGYLYANSEDVNLSFAGEMPASNTANVTVDLSYSDDATIPGFNLVGNPFTCNVNGFKLKNKTTSEVSDLSAYYVVEGGTEIVPSTDPIKPSQGFLVQATDENQQLVFNYAAAKGETATKPAFVRIEAGNDAFMDRAFVQIGQGNTLRKMKLNENVAHVWLMQDSKDYAAATIEEAQSEMPVSFKAAKDGEYTLTVNAENVELNYLHLIDNITGTDVDLFATPSYTFTANASDYASRFKLVFVANNENGPSTGSGTFAFIDASGNIIITADVSDATLQVIDAMGRVIRTVGLSQCGSRTTTAGMTPGVYVLRLIDGNDVKTQKIVIP